MRGCNMAIIVQQTVGFLIVLVLLLRYGDLTIEFIVSRQVVRAVLYGIASVLLLVALILAVLK